MMDQLQSALNGIDAYIGDTTDDKALLIRAKCRALMRGYHARWHTSDIVPVHVERTMTADLVNPETGRRSRSYMLAGKMDVIAHRGEARRILIDHKTCSEDIEDPESPWWRQKIVEGQVNHYMLLGWLNAERFDDAIWDAIRKPSIAPKKLSAANRKAIASGMDYCGHKPSAETVAAMVDSDRETLELYEARLADDCINVRPSRYFQRRSVPRMDSELFEYAKELWDHGQDMLYSRREKRRPRNSGACMLYGSPCTFLGICSGHDSPESDRWKPKEWVHPELPILEGANGREIVTNSRVRCFQTCRRKEYYEYQMGIERHDEEEREALYFGSCLHAGLNAWWSYLLPRESDDGNES